MPPACTPTPDAAARDAIADVVSSEELHPPFITPSVFHPDETKRVASAISGRDG